MIVLGYDTETTGLDTAKDTIIEVGAVLYDTKERAPLEVFNTFVRPRSALPEGYVSPTGIKGEWLVRHGISFPDAMGKIQHMAAAADLAAIAAHNGNNFDKPITIAELARDGIKDHLLEATHWIDTRQDLPFEKEPPNRSLLYLAADQGFVNPFPHRAITDVLTMLRVLERYDVDAVLAHSKIPLIWVRACVTYDMAAEREHAKTMRYRYFKEENNIWKRQIRETDFDKEVADAAAKGFRVVKL